MKFNALDIGIFFTWWEADKHLTGIKTGERQAFCLNTREFITLHHNKDVKDYVNVTHQKACYSYGIGEILFFGRFCVR